MSSVGISSWLLVIGSGVREGGHSAQAILSFGGSSVYSGCGYGGAGELPATMMIFFWCLPFTSSFPWLGVDVLESPGNNDSQPPVPLD